MLVLKMQLGKRTGGGCGGGWEQFQDIMRNLKGDEE